MTTANMDEITTAPVEEDVVGNFFTMLTDGFQKIIDFILTIIDSIKEIVKGAQE